MACMYADGQLAPGQAWRQEGILGTVFEGSIQVENGLILPSITSTAYVTAESSLILDADDPFRLGITP
jgi:4-hydroxyproline epimerase